MPHETLKILPGVDVNRTLALNEAGISTCQLIRQAVDRQGMGLIQKLGGWTRYFPQALPAIVRALWGWQDLNKRKYLAVGCETSATPGVGAPLIAISNGASNDITPLVRQDDVTIDVTTATGSNVVTIVDMGSDVSSYVSVFVPAHISVGGVIIFGFYPCYAVDMDTFELRLLDKFGNPAYATATETNAGAVAIFDTTAGTSTVEVTLPDHGYAAGDIYPVLISTDVGGITLVGEYDIQEIIDADTFTIFSANEAVTTDTQSINGGEARYNFYLAFGTLPMGTGYGVGAYGAGAYGSGITPVPPSGDNINTDSWALDNNGQLLVAVPTGTTFGSPDGTTLIGGPIYLWSPTQNNPTAFVLNRGPIANAGAFVAMPQQQIIAWGSTFNGAQDPLLLRWNEVGNLGIWVGEPDNQAGSYRLTRGSRIVAGMQGPQQALIFTDLAVWSMQYKGPDNIYGFNEIAAGCGLIGPKAVGVLADEVYWMGPQQFFTLGGQGVQVLYCPIWDVVFQNLDPDAVDAIRAAPNSLFNEFTWYVTSLDSPDGENDMYVKYNKLLGPQNGWDYGMLSRTAWIDQTVLGSPIGADNSSLLMQHETSNNADGQPMLSNFQTGYFVLSEADVLLFIDQVWPDAKWGKYGNTPNATLNITFYVKEYPGDEAPRVYGPYAMTQLTKYLTPGVTDPVTGTMGFRGRLVSLLFSSNDIDSFWRQGAMRYRYSPDGKFL